MNLNEMISDKVREAEQIIYGYMPTEGSYEQTVIDAMEYSVKAGGKRLRPLIMLETARIYSGDEAQRRVGAFMAALEMIHTYSLVHDDLPAMDNDTLRRGQPTTWAKYGDGMAVLTGDALLNYAYETAMKAFDAFDVSEYPRVVRALRYLSEKAGIYGMVGGQVADVEAEKKKISLDNDRLIFIHEKKTGALLQAAFVIGAILGGAPDEDIEALSKAALDIGVAFQIQDDILDITGDEKELGKNIGSDEESGKETYVTLHGMEKAKEMVIMLSEEAVKILKEINGDSEFLVELARALTERRY